jgi:PKD repeat protein
MTISRWRLATGGLVLAALTACGGGNDAPPTSDISTPVITPTVSNLSPVGGFAISATGLAAAFDATASRDADGSVASYQWNFGDGSPVQTVSTATTTHVFAAAGTYTVNLVVLDAQGAASSVVSHNITVAALPAVNQPPVAVFVPAVNNLSVGVNASQSTDPDGTVTGYAWNFGENASASNTASGVSAAHTYAAAGSYTVTLTVTDNAGATAVSQQQVTVNVPPNVSPVASFVAVPNALLVAFDGAASADSDGSIASYAWNFGEPTSGAANTAVSATSSTATHAYAAAGSYTATLTVTDNQGATGIKLVNVTVSPPAAVATGKLNDTGITASQCYQAGSNVLLSCTSAAAIGLNSAQDGMQGRDAAAATNSATDGKLGFSFTKIGANGETLPASATAWNCVKDNVTGMMWEVKTSDGGLRDGAKTYTNVDSTAADQWGTGINPTQAQIDAASNSVGFKNAVNTVGLCGATDWRLPTADELQGIVDYGVAYPGPTINATWFPNTYGGPFWSSSPYVGSPYYAWIVSFKGGFVGGSFGGLNRDFSYSARLVRAGQ